MSSILLTGATGFIGSHLLDVLVRLNKQVVVAKRSTSDTWRIKHLLDSVSVCNVDESSIDSIFEEHNIETIIHLATLYRKFDSVGDLKNMVDSNVTFPLQLIETGLRKNLKLFVNTGTYFEYDCTELPVRETAAIKPFNLYARTKLAFESMLESYASQISVRTFRLFSPYGEKDNKKLIPYIIQSAVNHEPLKLSEGLQKLDFVYVTDIVDAYLKVIESVNENASKYEVFNIGSGVAISVREVVSLVEQQLGESINKSWGDPSIVDYPLVVADVSKAKKLLGWSPKISMRQGIANIFEYYSKQKVDEN